MLEGVSFLLFAEEEAGDTREYAAASIGVSGLYTGGPVAPSCSIIVSANTGGSAQVTAWDSVSGISSPDEITTWYPGTVTADLRDATEMRMSYVSGDVFTYSGMAMSTWHPAASVGAGQYRWNWSFLGMPLSYLAGTFLLEMRDADTLEVLDSITVNVSTLGTP
jgi:hypothetical protein